jgi:hypothetical protein
LLEPKEQAKYYIEKIRSIAKSTNQTLLIIFIPLTFLWLTEIEKNYTVANEYITQVKARLKAQKEEREFYTGIRNINKAIDELYSSLPDSVRGRTSFDNKEGPRLALIKYETFETKISSLNLKLHKQYKKSNAISDSIRLDLEKLKLPITIPILNIKFEKVSLKWMTLVIMVFFTIMAAYAYLMKRKIVVALNKFKAIISAHFSRPQPNQYRDYDLKLPFWFFPIKASRTNRAWLATIGLTKRNVKNSNIVVWGCYIIFVLINVRLLMINWDLNYKVFHHNYSILTGIGFFLFFLQIIFFVLLIQKINDQAQSTARAVQQYNATRRRFLTATALAALGAVIIEPIYGAIDQHKKWFHTPRFRRSWRKKAKMRKGFYVTRDNLNSTAIRVYYFDLNGHNPVTKTMREADWPFFQKKLKPLTASQILSHPNIQLKLKQKDIIQSILENVIRGNDQFLLMDHYLSAVDDMPTAEYIDLYTKLMISASPRRPINSEGLQKIKARISEISNKRPKYLKGYDIGDDNWIYRNINKKKNVDVIKKKLQDESMLRLGTWQNKLNRGRS